MMSGDDAPGERSAIYHSCDLDETRQIVAGLYCEHQLDQTRLRDRLDYQHVHQRMGAFSFSRMRYGAEVRIVPRQLQSFFLVQVPLTGGDRMCIDGRELRCDCGHASIHGPESRLGMRWSADCEKFVVRIERDALERHASALAGEEWVGTVSFQCLVDLQHTAAQAWVDTARHLFGELRRNPRLSDTPLVREQFEQLLMTGALNWLPGRVIDGGGRDNRLVLPRHVKIAEEYMRAHPDLPITVETLALHTGVSGRTLHEGFRRFLGVSPIRYLRDLRMERARADLLDPGQPRSVTSIAMRWGFFQLGRFASDYRRRFGEHPHESLLKSR